MKGTVDHQVRKSIDRLGAVRIVVALSVWLLVLPTIARAEWPPQKFTNLKVLPPTIGREALLDTMRVFTRALGVRCTFCHVGDESLPISTYHFADDSKIEKRTARVMMNMVRDLNEKYLPTLEERSKYPAPVQCFTCHRGVGTPRTLQSVLLRAHGAGGLDSTLATYRALRKRYYGRAAYDFGPVTLVDVASTVSAGGHPDDGVQLNALNVEMNPESDFAKREYAASATLQAFRHGDADSATALVRQLKARFGSAIFTEDDLNQMGYTLLGEKKAAAAVAVFKLGVESFPASANSYDSLGDAYAANGDRKLAIENYEKALKIAPSDETKKKLDALRKGGKR